MSEDKGYYSEDRGQFVTDNEMYLDILAKANINKYKIDVTKKLSPPQGLLQIKGFDGELIQTMRRGTLGQLKGKKKVGKTSTILNMLMTLLSSKGNLSQISSNNTLDVLIIDTEQDEYDIMPMAKYINEKNTNIKLNVHIYFLAEFSRTERKNITKSLIYTTKNIGVVIIDGIVDLCVDFMNNVESSQLVDDLSKWAKQTNTHILSVLHENKSKNDENSRGPLGTELDNKAHYTWRITNDETTKIRSIISAPSRTKDFPTIFFKLDDDKIPYEVDAPEKIVNSKPRTPRPDELTEIEQQSIVKEVFTTPLNATNSVNSLILHIRTQKINALDGKDGIKIYLQYLVKENYLTKRESYDKGNRGTFYSLHSRLK
jgi:archaellum biogenesis ATPase FlaH